MLSAKPIFCNDVYIIIFNVPEIQMILLQQCEQTKKTFIFDCEDSFWDKSPYCQNWKKNCGNVDAFIPSADLPPVNIPEGADKTTEENLAEGEAGLSMDPPVEGENLLPPGGETPPESGNLPPVETLPEGEVVVEDDTQVVDDGRETALLAEESAGGDETTKLAGETLDDSEPVEGEVVEETLTPEQRRAQEEQQRRDAEEKARQEEVTTNKSGQVSY